MQKVEKTLQIKSLSKNTSPGPKGMYDHTI